MFLTLLEKHKTCFFHLWRELQFFFLNYNIQNKHLLIYHSIQTRKLSSRKKQHYVTDNKTLSQSQR